MLTKTQGDKGDTVLLSDGTAAEVISVRTKRLTKPVPVYDIQVDGVHEFFANGVLIHNSGGGAYTVGVKMALDFEDRYWILDVVRGQWDSGTRDIVIKRTAREEGIGVEIAIEEEPGSGGKQSAFISVQQLAGFRVKADKVGKSDGDKLVRADAFSSQVNVGNVLMVKAAWNETYLKELRFFPNSRFKDQVDASSLAFNRLANRKRTIGLKKSR